MDKLSSISLEDLPSLISVYERSTTKDLLAIYNLASYKKWLENQIPRSNHLQIDVKCLNQDWTTDGLFLLIHGDSPKSVFPFTRGTDNPRIRTALKLLLQDPAEDYVVKYVHSHCKDVVKLTLDEMHLSRAYYFLEFNYYVCPVEKSMRVTYTVPDHILLKPLSPEVTPEIIQYLPYKSPYTEKLFRFSIESMGSSGAYSKSTGELMAWCLLYPNECHSALTVKPEFRGQGLGKLLTQKLTLDRALENKPSHCMIKKDNHVSEHIFLSLGYEIVSGCENGGRRLN